MDHASLTDFRGFDILTSPVARATKLSAVLGTVFPNTPMTILPTSSSPILMSKYTWERRRYEQLFFILKGKYCAVDTALHTGQFHTAHIISQLTYWIDIPQNFHRNHLIIPFLEFD